MQHRKGEKDRGDHSPFPKLTYPNAQGRWLVYLLLASVSVHLHKNSMIPQGAATNPSPLGFLNASPQE